MNLLNIEFQHLNDLKILNNEIQNIVFTRVTERSDGGWCFWMRPWPGRGVRGPGMLARAVVARAASCAARVLTLGLGARRFGFYFGRYCSRP